MRRLRGSIRACRTWELALPQRTRLGLSPKNFGRLTAKLPFGGPFPKFLMPQENLCFGLALRFPLRGRVSLLRRHRGAERTRSTRHCRQRRSSAKVSAKHQQFALACRHPIEPARQEARVLNYGKGSGEFLADRHEFIRYTLKSPGFCQSICCNVQFVRCHTFAHSQFTARYGLLRSVFV